MSEKISIMLSKFKEQGTLVVKLEDNDRTIAFYNTSGATLYKLEDIDHATELYAVWTTNK